MLCAHGKYRPVIQYVSSNQLNVYLHNKWDYLCKGSFKLSEYIHTFSSLETIKKLKCFKILSKRGNRTVDGKIETQIDKSAFTKVTYRVPLAVL